MNQAQRNHPVGRLSYVVKDRLLAWTLIIPAFVVVFALILMPMLRALWMSVHTIDLKRPALGQPFVGLDNYIDILQDGFFWASIASAWPSSPTIRASGCYTAT